MNSLSPAPGPFNLGNTAYLGQETTQDRQALYSTLVNVYKWTDKAHEYSNVAHQILSQNSLKRSSMNTNRAKRNRQPGAHTFSPQYVLLFRMEFIIVPLNYKMKLFYSIY